MHETNSNDTESALLPEGMEKSVCVFVLVENGVAVWLYFGCVARSVDIVFFSIVLNTAKTLAKPSS